MSQIVREIVLDTETTGLYTRNGDRIIEIGCVELINRRKSGAFYHQYINPEKEINAEAFKVHGISNDFLKDKPAFSKIAKEFLSFVGTSTIIIHNATFDLNFLNHELGLLGHQEIHSGRVIDTLIMARRKFPGAPASLDALCKKFNISLDTREKHGALIDADLLASVYIELLGGNQGMLSLDNSTNKASAASNFETPAKFRAARVFELTDEEKLAHENLISSIQNPIWKKINAS